jgi:hypothetical protein
VRVLLVGGPRNGDVHDLPHDAVASHRPYVMQQYEEGSPRPRYAAYHITGLRDLVHGHIIYAFQGLQVNRCVYTWTASRELEKDALDKKDLVFLAANAIDGVIRKCFIELGDEGYTLIPGFRVHDATEGLTPMPGMEELFSEQYIQVKVECLAYKVSA